MPLFEKWLCEIKHDGKSEEPTLEKLKKVGQCKITEEEAETLNKGRKRSGNQYAEFFFLAEEQPPVQIGASTGGKKSRTAKKQEEVTE